MTYILQSAGVAAVLGIAIIFWLTQLVDVMIRDQRRFESHTHKLTWFLVILIGNFIGALWYFFWRRKNA